MPFSYGQKTGVTTTVKLVKALCDIYSVFSSTIIQWVNNSSLAPADKTTVLNWLAAVTEICTLLKPLSTY